MFNIQTLQKFIANGGTPKALLEQAVLKNPLMNNLIRIAERGDVQDVENFARNLFAEQGRNFDEEFAEFKSRFK